MLGNVRSRLIHRETATLQVQRMAEQTFREQQVAQHMAHQLERSEQENRTMVSHAQAVFALQSEELAEVTRHGRVFAEEKTRAETKFAEVVAGLKDASAEVVAQRDYIRSLEEHYWEIG